jgi:hypothetical protein
MKTIVGNGFGHFSRVVGPWQGYFPTSGGFGLADNQFGLGIGTTIAGGSRGATITSLTIEPPFNVAGVASAMLWRLTVVRGPIPPSLAQLDNKWQHALGGYPAIGDNDQELPVLWSKMFYSNNVANQGDAFGQAQMTHFTFPDLTGPSVGPGEEMTVFITRMENGLAAAAVSSTYIAMTVRGVEEQRPANADDKDQTARSIPRGRVGGF